MEISKSIPQPCYKKLVSVAAMLVAMSQNEKLPYCTHVRPYIQHKQETEQKLGFCKMTVLSETNTFPTRFIAREKVNLELYFHLEKYCR